MNPVRMTIDERLIRFPTSAARYLAAIEPLHRGDYLKICRHLTVMFSIGTKATMGHLIARELGPGIWRPEPLDESEMFRLEQVAWCLEHRDQIRCEQCAPEHHREHGEIEPACHECGRSEDVEEGGTRLAVRLAAAPDVVVAVHALDDRLCGSCFDEGMRP